MKSISLVIPAYNEEENIPVLIDSIKKILPNITDDFEIIIVDDASTDSTPSLLNGFACLDKNIVVIRNLKNRKLGGALKEGFKRASKELVLYIDADLAFDLTEIKKAIDILTEKNADFVSAYRINRGVDGLRRSIYSYFYNKMVNFIFKLELKDVNFAFKLFKREVLGEITLESEGSFISAELLIKAKLKGFKIAQLPVKYFSRTGGRSMLSSPAVIAKILFELNVFYFRFFRKNNRQNSLFNQISAIYKNSRFFQRIYIYLRLKTCPFALIEQYVPKKGKIIDLGCGLGLFSAFMLLRSEEREITAVDQIKNRINFANSLKIKANFILADISNFALNACDAVVLIDVLYLLPYNKQQQLLLKCYQALSPGGVVIVKEIDPAPSLKYAWCLVQEIFVTKVCRRNLSTGLYFIKKNNLIKILEEIGFNIKSIRLDKGYLFPHILYLCTNEKNQKNPALSPTI